MSLLNWLNKRPDQPNDCPDKNAECSTSKKPKENQEQTKTAFIHKQELAVSTNMPQFTILTENTPACWSVSQCEMFKTSNEWLIVENKALGCLGCKKIRVFCVTSVKSLRISKAWQKCTVTENCKTKDTQQLSLRKKKLEHKKAHTIKHLKFCTNLKKEKF